MDRLAATLALGAMTPRNTAMLNKFLFGLAFGLGFSLSLVIVLSLWLNYDSSPSYMSQSTGPVSSGSITVPYEDKYPFIENFSDLPIEEKIAHSTAIVVTNIKKNDEGIYEQKITEILKKQDDVELYYQVGDVYDDHSDYNEYEDKGRFVPKGFIVFMGGSPASMRYSVSHSGDRISSLGGLSMEMLRDKCD